MTDAPTYRYQVVPGEVHDGDTLWVDVDLGFSIRHIVKVRLASINAPELSTPAGLVARDALAGFIAARPGRWMAQTFKSGNDTYGRWLANVYAPEGTQANAWMVANGYAVLYGETAVG